MLEKGDLIVRVRCETLPRRRSGSFANTAQEEEWELRKHRPGER